jgi:hypothetical protein
LSAEPLHSCHRNFPSEVITDSISAASARPKSTWSVPLFFRELDETVALQAFIRDLPVSGAGAVRRSHFHSRTRFTTMNTSIKSGVVLYIGYSHTEKQAQGVVEGVTAAADSEVPLVKVDQVDQYWDQLNRHGIFLGAGARTGHLLPHIGTRGRRLLPVAA